MKQPFYKNGFKMGVIFIFLSLALSMVSAGVAAVAFMVGLVLILVSLFRGGIKKNEAKRQKVVVAQTKDDLFGRCGDTITKSGDKASVFDTDVVYTSVPDTYNGGGLAYSYTDVRFNCPDECKALAQKVPKNQRIGVKLNGSDKADPRSVELRYKDQVIGYLYNNKLKDMVVDFARDPDRSFLILGGDQKEGPYLNMYFYKPDLREADNEDTNEDDEE